MKIDMGFKHYRALGLLTILASEAVAGSTPDGPATLEPERTAVAVVLEGERLPEISAMQSWFVVEGEPRRVLAVEKGPAEVVVVRDPSAQEYLDILARAFLNRELRNQEWRLAEEENRKPVPLAAQKHQRGQGLMISQRGTTTYVGTGSAQFSQTGTDAELAPFRNVFQSAFSLGERTRLRFIEAQAAPVSRTTQAMSVFNLSTSFPTGIQGFLAFVEAVPTLPFELRFADAVAISAQDLYAQACRRAVVVLIDGQSADRSLYEAAAVREFARQLQIPVFVWSFGPGAFVAGWDGRLIGQRTGHLDTALALVNFEDVWEDLNTVLAAQRIVWIEGHHPPSEMSLSSAAQGIRLAGSAASPSGPAGSGKSRP